MSFDTAFPKQLKDEFAPEAMDEVLADGPWFAEPSFSLANVVLTPYLDRLNRPGLTPMWTRARPRLTN